MKQNSPKREENGEEYSNKDKEEEKGNQIEKKIKRPNYSKYDLIKIKIKLENHYYIFSRFLISRLLNLIKVKPRDAIRITLNLKKFLVEENLLEIDQENMNSYLFKIMNSLNYGEEYTKRYKIITKFYQKRTPLIILVGGTYCIGKSTIVTQLSQRINIGNILQTNIVLDMMNSINADSIQEENFWGNKDLSPEEFIHLYNVNCKLIRNGVNFDIFKAFNEGKPVIIEGRHLNPIFYINMINQGTNEINEISGKDSKVSIIIPFSEGGGGAGKYIRDELSKIDQENAIIIPFILTLDYKSHYICIENRLIQLHTMSQRVKQKEKLRKEKQEKKKEASQRELSAECRKEEPEEIPINPLNPLNAPNLQMNKDRSEELKEVNNKYSKYSKLIEDLGIGESSSSLSVDGGEKYENNENKGEEGEMEGKIDILLKNGQMIQNYLLTISKGIMVIPINLNDFNQTLDIMHDAILNQIIHAYDNTDF